MNPCRCGNPLLTKANHAQGRCAKCATEARRAFIRANPWATSLYKARHRCNSPRYVKYADYGGRGIKCRLSLVDAHFLWNRDGAGAMKRPSIDRINPDGDYELDNCRFVELSTNSAGARYGMPGRIRKPYKRNKKA
jgi:hypothetical protein